jgi:CHAD domain-containing protein
MTGEVEHILINALDQRWKDYRIQSKTCRREFSEEAVHDLRIATRRFLAVLDIVRGVVDPQPRIQKARRFFKDQIDELDELRDVQVMLLELEENIPEVPEIVLFESPLQKREKRLLSAARRIARDADLSGIRKRVDKIRTELEIQTEDEEFVLGLLRAIDNAYARVRQAYDQIEPRKPATIHALRLAFKKFRYMVEILSALLPAPPEDYFKHMHDYQSAMGDVRDLSVFQAALAEFIEEGNAVLDAKPILRYFERQLAQRVSNFMEDKGEVHTFWRAAPDLPFPWEESHDAVHRPARRRRTSGSQRGRGRQPASSDRKRPPKDGPDGPGPAAPGNAVQPDPVQSHPASHTDGEHPGGDAEAE